MQKIITDPEGVFISIQEDMSEKLNIDMEAVPTNYHERVVERFIRTIRERIRINIHSQEYKVPSYLIQNAVNKPVSDLNDSPNSKTINVSPRQMVTGIKLNYKTDICPPWGTIIDLKVSKHKHSSENRIQVGIVVGKSSNRRGGVKVVIINDGKLSRVKERHRYWI